MIPRLSTRARRITVWIGVGTALVELLRRFVDLLAAWRAL